MSSNLVTTLTARLYTQVLVSPGCHAELLQVRARAAVRLAGHSVPALRVGQSVRLPLARREMIAAGPHRPDLRSGAGSGSARVRVVQLVRRRAVGLSGISRKPGEWASSQRRRPRTVGRCSELAAAAGAAPPEAALLIS